MSGRELRLFPDVVVVAAQGRDFDDHYRVIEGEGQRGSNYLDLDSGQIRGIRPMTQVHNEQRRRNMKCNARRAHFFLAELPLSRESE